MSPKVIIIGAGVSGLSVGCYLQLGGRIRYGTRVEKILVEHDQAVRIPAGSSKTREALAQYIARPPLSLL